MNKNIIFYIIIFLCCGASYATANPKSFEVRGGAFFPTDKTFRDIYSNALPFYEFQGSWQARCPLDLWLNFSGITKNGHVACCDGKSKIRLYDISAGLNYVKPINCRLSGYLGLGAAFGIVTISNKWCCDHSYTSKFAFGGVIKSGFYYTFGTCYFLDFFVDYLYQPVDFDHNVDLGGVKTGIGIGFSF